MLCYVVVDTAFDLEFRKEMNNCMMTTRRFILVVTALVVRQVLFSMEIQNDAHIWSPMHTQETGHSSVDSPVMPAHLNRNT